MNLTHQDLSSLIEELAPLLVPSRIQRIYEENPRRLIFQLRAPGRTFHLLMAFSPDETRLHLVHDKPAQAAHPTSFTMQLRRWLQGARLEALSLTPQDRIIGVDIQAVHPDWEPADEDERPPRQALTLILELVGAHPNLFLVDDEEKIIGAASWRTLQDRETRAGAPYEPPSPPKAGVDARSPLPFDLRELPPDGSRSHALATFLDEALKRSDDEARRRELARALRSQARRLKRRITNIESDLAKIDDAQEFKKWGQLLQSAYGKVQPGATSATVPDFYKEGMPPIEIPLDPARSLQQNIDRYFHQYRRYSQAKDKVETRQLETMELLEEVEKARGQLPEIEPGQALQDFQQRLIRARILPRPAPRGRRQRDRKPLPPYREFRARSGTIILVGRGASHNDRLTTSIARGRDIWLHARDWSGAHVVLRQERGQKPASEDLLDAALLAAHFSRGREDTYLDVTYTEAKHVRKPPGAPPGLVSIAGGSTITVRPDDDRLQDLLHSEVFHDPSS